MLTEQESARARKALLVNWIIWFVIFFSLVIYLVVAHLVGADIQTADLPEVTYRMILKILMGLGTVQLVVSFPLRKFIINSGQKRGLPGRRSDMPRPDIDKVVQRYSIALVIALALCESVGIYGLVIFFLGQDLQTLYLFVAASAAAMVLHRPRMSEIEDVFEL